MKRRKEKKRGEETVFVVGQGMIRIIFANEVRCLKTLSRGTFVL
jgi:hypothetical protein